MYKYADESVEFSDTLEAIKTIQENELLNKGLTGEFNSTIAKLMLSNHCYSDKQQVEQTNNVKLDFNKPLSALFEETSQLSKQ